MVDALYERYRKLGHAELYRMLQAGETRQVEDVADTWASVADTAASMAASLRRDLDRLQPDWIGRASDEFHYRLEMLVRYAQVLADEAASIRTGLAGMADALAEAKRNAEPPEPAGVVDTAVNAVLGAELGRVLPATERQRAHERMVTLVANLAAEYGVADHSNWPASVPNPPLQLPSVGVVASIVGAVTAVVTGRKQGGRAERAERGHHGERRHHDRRRDRDNDRSDRDRSDNSDRDRSDRDRSDRDRSDRDWGRSDRDRSDRDWGRSDRDRSDHRHGQHHQNYQGNHRLGGERVGLGLGSSGTAEAFSRWSGPDRAGLSMPDHHSGGSGHHATSTSGSGGGSDRSSGGTSTNANATPANASGTPAAAGTGTGGAPPPMAPMAPAMGAASMGGAAGTSGAGGVGGSMGLDAGISSQQWRAPDPIDWAEAEDTDTAPPVLGG